jgi:hypothetical protein
MGANGWLANQRPGRLQPFVPARVPMALNKIAHGVLALNR